MLAVAFKQSNIWCCFNLTENTYIVGGFKRPRQLLNGPKERPVNFCVQRRCEINDPAGRPLQFSKILKQKSQLISPLLSWVTRYIVIIGGTVGYFRWLIEIHKYRMEYDWNFLNFRRAKQHELSAVVLLMEINANAKSSNISIKTKCEFEDASQWDGRASAFSGCDYSHPHQSQPPQQPASHCGNIDPDKCEWRLLFRTAACVISPLVSIKAAAAFRHQDSVSV